VACVPWEKTIRPRGQVRDELTWNSRLVENVHHSSGHKKWPLCAASKSCPLGPRFREPNWAAFVAALGAFSSEVVTGSREENAW